MIMKTRPYGKRSACGSLCRSIWDGPEQERLERLTEETRSTKSDVLRRGLEALGREVFDPEHHPALRIIGIAGVAQCGEGDLDVAREHDRHLADLEDRRLSKKGSGDR